MSRPTILLSGFEPFGEFKSNPTERLVAELGKERFPFALETVLLPVSFQNAFERLKTEIDRVRPHYVVCTGLAGERDQITPERVAINCLEAPIPDNDGVQPQGLRIDATQADGIFSDLPLDELVRACRAHQIKSAVSNSAGTYVCNYLMFRTLVYAKSLGFKAGFIHVPPTPDMKAAGPHMEFEKILTGVRKMLEVLARS